MSRKTERVTRYKKIKREITGFEPKELENRLKDYWEKSSKEDREIIELISKEFEYSNRMKELHKMSKQALELHKEAKEMNAEELAEEAWSHYEEITLLERTFKKMAHTDEVLTEEERRSLASFFGLDYNKADDKRFLEELIKQQKDYDRRTLQE